MANVIKKAVAGWKAFGQEQKTNRQISKTKVKVADAQREGATRKKMRAGAKVTSGEAYRNLYR